MSKRSRRKAGANERSFPIPPKREVAYMPREVRRTFRWQIRRPTRRQVVSGAQKALVITIGAALAFLTLVATLEFVGWRGPGW